MSRFWMVRAGRGADQLPHWTRDGLVAIGFTGKLDMTSLRSAEELRARHDADCIHSGAKAAAGFGAMRRFRFEMETGDTVVSYDPDSREYWVGKVTGDYKYVPGVAQPHTRPVTWRGKVNRDGLGPAARGSLGSIMTIFEPADVVRTEVEALLSGEKAPTRQTPADQTAQAAMPEEEPLREDVAGRAHEQIKDKLLALSWEDMQEMVAALLRAMGIKTRVSPKGSDRGKDIVASPDGLGLETPRIKVEVKHRERSISAPAIRSFVGGLRADDRGLFVSTGGFTDEAKYEAERAQMAVTLLTFDDLAELLVEHYDALDSEGRALLPLVRVYVPA